jgi:chloramphenicol 3-O-phosphotransferase
VRLPAAVHLRGDVFRRMIVSGRADMTNPPSAEAERQLNLRYELAAGSARRYAEAGFTVIYQDVVLGAALHRVLERLAGLDAGLVVLNPDTDTLARRDAEREKTGYAGGWTPALLEAGVRETPPLGLWIDNGAMTVDETVEAILSDLPGTRTGIVR